MTRIVGLAREIAGLFVDDGSLAIAVLAVLGATAALAAATGNEGLAAPAFLLVGVIGALLENVVRSARAAREPG